MIKLYTKISITALLLIQFVLTQPINAQNCWSALGSGIGTPADPGGIFVSTVYNGNLIVAGRFDTAGGVPAANIAAWNGSSWSALGSGIKLRAARFSNSSGIIHGLAVYNGDLYVCGDFDIAGGMPASNIAKWDGTTWSVLSIGIPSFTVLGPYDTVGTHISSLAVYNNELYVSGSFASAGGIPAADIAKWNGSSWSAVGAGIATSQDPTITSVDFLAAINGKLYAGGDFENASGVTAVNIAAWDGSSWSALGVGIGNDTAGNGGVVSIVNYNGEVYTTYLGVDPNYTPAFIIERWDGITWHNVVGGPGTGTYFNGYVFTMYPFNGNLVAAGYFSLIGGTYAYSLAQYDGTSWSAMGIGTDSSEYYSLVNYNNHLYLGGYYSTVGGIPAPSVAEYTCATSSGINEVSAADEVHLFPNPTNGIINISVENLQSKGSIQIYNLLGQKVLQADLNTDKTEINLAGQAAGTYLYHISGKNAEFIGSGTLVVQ